MAGHSQKDADEVNPLGVFGEHDTPSLFCTTAKDPKKLLILSALKKSPFHFSGTSHKAVITDLFDKNFRIEHVRDIASARAGRKTLVTFLYGNAGAPKLYFAVQKGKNEFLVSGEVAGVKERGGLVSNVTHKKAHILYYGESNISLAYSENFRKWSKAKEPVLKPRPGFFDGTALVFLGAHACEKGILVFYVSSAMDASRLKLQIGAALFAASDPAKLIWRSDTPLFEETMPAEHGIRPIGAVFFDGETAIYFHSPSRGIFAISLPLPFSKEVIKRGTPKLSRAEENPIIVPKKSWWRSQGTLNPAAINLGGTVHLLFRAMGDDGISRIGYAMTRDGITIDDVYPEPVFSLRRTERHAGKTERYFDPVMYPSGGSWGGCEDPRIVRIGDRLYMTFNSFDDWDHMRVGLTSISIKDFLAHRWNWKQPELISAGRAKNWVIFPEKIRGKYAILHSIYGKTPDRVLVDYVADLDHVKRMKIDKNSPDPQLMPNRRIAWHTHMRSASTPPIRTKDGWLVFYHAHDAAEPHRYKLGAILLDLDDPSKIIARAAAPVLTPDMWYENDWKPGIVYACGAVVRGETLFIYYGGGDKHVCVATAPLAEFLERLKKGSSMLPSIHKVVIS